MSYTNDRIAFDLERARKLIIQGLFVALVCFILFEALRGHQYWSKVKGEGNLWNYGSSLDYAFAGEMAALNALIVYYCSKLSGARMRKWVWVPWALTAAALLFFACDEMLCIHEKAGLILQSHVHALQHSRQGRGDGIVMGAYVLCTMVFSSAVLGRLLTTRASRIYFAIGLLGVAILGLFEGNPSGTLKNYMPFRETEELVEVFAGWAFTSAFLSTAVDRLSWILRNTEVRRQAETAAGEPSLPNKYAAARNDG